MRRQYKKDRISTKAAFGQSAAREPPRIESSTGPPASVRTTSWRAAAENERIESRVDEGGKQETSLCWRGITTSPGEGCKNNLPQPAVFQGCSCAQTTRERDFEGFRNREDPGRKKEARMIIHFTKVRHGLRDRNQIAPRKRPNERASEGEQAQRRKKRLRDVQSASEEHKQSAKQTMGENRSVYTRPVMRWNDILRAAPKGFRR
ncbi:hypothetical protein B0H15DRAFT_807651 [Mycena belliarum]|uniref:Uncharacterized protein n=1 Tax=Mycena belliarum TaxID=1033014 RepID=A0AAD6TP59_9AGAR|nr:hypothetical protein B0H15DRAFT_807651 [Mycena belliae]